MSVHVAINNFNSGEVSPLLDARWDSDKYKAGCRELTNMIPRPYGPAFKRPGMEYMGAAGASATSQRLVGFNFSTTTNFILEFGHEYLRFWSNRQQVESSPGVAYQKTTVWDSDEIKSLQFTQINDVMYIVHPSFHPYKLSRVADDNWTLAEVTWDWPPMGDENVTTTTIAASAKTGTGITLTASAAVFQTGSPSPHIGSYWQIGHRRAVQAKNATGVVGGSYLYLTTAAVDITSDSVLVLGRWEFYSQVPYTSGTATIHIERSYDKTTWEAIRSFTLSGNRSPIANGEEIKEAFLRLRFDYIDAIGGATAFTLEPIDSKVYGLVKITAVASSTSATADVINDLGDTAATVYWTEGAFSTYQGFPRSVAFHEQRIVYGGTARSPQTIWGSFIGDFQNFRRTSRDDAGISYTLASSQANKIQWMASHDDLVLATSGEEWVMSSGDSEKPITPTNVVVKMHSRYGSAHIQGITLNESVLFVQRNKRKVREFTWAYEQEGYVAPDMTLLAEHITEGGISQMAFANQPDSVLWVIRADGCLLGMTYERDQQVVAWHKHTTGTDTSDTFESVAVIYGAADDDPDEVWFSVKRTINSATVRYIESFSLIAQAHDFSDRNEQYFTDCHKRVPAVGTVAATTTFAGYDHLAGRTPVGLLTRSALSPGVYFDGFAGFAGGTITTATNGTALIAGLPYTAVVKPMKFEMTMQDGTAQGRMQRIDRLVVRRFQSIGGSVVVDQSATESHSQLLSSTTGTNGYVGILATNEVELALDCRHKSALDMYISHSDPVNLAVVALIVKMNVIGN